MNSPKTILSRIKAHSWDNASVSFYIVKRKLVRRSANYQILQVNIDEKLKSRLRRIAIGKIQDSNDAREYDFNSADLDDDVLALRAKDTDFQEISNQLLSAMDPPYADSFESLLDSWVYIARLDSGKQPPLFTVRRVSEGWTTKKVSQLINLVYRNNMLVDLGKQEIFRIDAKIDFFVFGGVMFIADKKNFELALNFREGMERNRDLIVEDLKEIKAIENVEAISTYVGDNLRLLRRLSQAKKSGYYKQPGFLKALKEISAKKGWSLYSPDGKIIITKENVEFVLRLLNNDRLVSEINREEFDVDVKHKAGAAPGISDDGALKASVRKLPQRA